MRIINNYLLKQENEPFEAHNIICFVKAVHQAKQRYHVHVTSKTTEVENEQEMLNIRHQLCFNQWPAAPMIN